MSTEVPDHFYRGDFLKLSDFSGTVTFHRIGGTSQTVEHAIRIPYRGQSHGNERKTLRITGTMTWIIPDSALVSPPRSDDRIVDSSGNVWTVVCAQTSLDRWIITTHNERTADAFASVLIPEVPVFSKSGSGDQVITWKAVSSGVRAGIYPMETSWSDGKEEKSSVRIFVAGNLSPERGMRLRGTDDKIYNIRTFRYPVYNPGITELEAEQELP
ncbi:MAG: hypothetical protein Q4C47_00730 [Planctomycetia bacterium]|nr:hypothetical protein [Planctomycetia bacterium]